MGRWDQHLSAKVTAFLFGRDLIFPVHTSRPGGNHGFHQLISVQWTAKACFSIGNDWYEVVLNGLEAFGPFDLIGPHQSIINSTYDLRDRVGWIQRLVRVGRTRSVSYGWDLA